MRGFLVIALAGLFCALGASAVSDGQQDGPPDRGHPRSGTVSKARPSRAKNRAANGRGKFVPPKGKCLLIIGQDQAGIDEYANAIARPFAGVMTYISAHDPGRLGEFKNLRDRYPRAVFQVGLDIVDQLETIDRGERDVDLKEIGRVFKESRRPVYLRVGYEFDFPGNHYEPAGYVRAFRKIHDLFMKQEVLNVAFVWHSYGYGVTEEISRWYPGDDYVDWFGVSFFGGDTVGMARMATLAARRGKPLMIAEATPRGIGVTQGKESWRRWFAPCFDFIARHDVQAFCYINWDWESIPMFRGQGWGDTRIQANEYVKTAWLKETQKSRYPVSGPSLDGLLGHKP